MTEKSNMKESPHSERTAHDAPKQVKAPGKSGEYTVDEMRRFLEEMSGKYDLARVVDPIECRILDFQNDGRIGMKERCYGIWNAEQKCVNCSSALACRTGCHQEKAERFQDEVYFIESNPVSLKLADGSVFDAVVELVNIEKDSTDLLQKVKQVSMKLPVCLMENESAIFIKQNHIMQIGRIHLMVKGEISPLTQDDLERMKI